MKPQKPSFRLAGLSDDNCVGYLSNAEMLINDLLVFYWKLSNLFTQ